MILVMVMALPGHADESVWAVIHTDTTTTDLSRSVADIQALEDYGSFQWGQLSRSAARTLNDSGIRVSIREEPFVLALGEMRFDPLTHFPPSDRANADSRTADPDFRLIQFRGPVRPQWLDQLRHRGIEPVQYIHPYTYVVWTDSQGKAAARNMGPVRWAGDFLPEFRVLPRHRGTDDRPQPATLLVSRHVAIEDVLDPLHAHGARVLNVARHGRNFHIVTIIAPANRRMDLAGIAGIYSVQPVFSIAPRDEMSNQSIVSDQLTSNQDIQPGYQDWLDGHGHDGNGVIISIIDGGILENHVDLADNMVSCIAQGETTSCTTSNNAHGTHVAGAVAGTGNSGNVDGDGFLRGQGVAPGASLVQQRYNSPGLAYDWGSACDSDEGQYCLAPDGIPILFREAALSGAVLTNNSWGSPGFGNGYDLPTQQVDAFVRDANPDVQENVQMLPIWAIQNGAGDFASGGCDPASLGSPEEAKNAFAVGASALRPGSTASGAVPNPSDIYSLAPNSAHGPACDGRTVPHIIAPGCFTQSTSAASADAYTTVCGTSMAAPVVTGAAGLFIEQYRSLYGTTPSPALIKSAFAATAIDLEGHTNADGDVMGHRPDRFQGFGRIDLDAVVNPPTDVFHLDQKILLTESGQSWSLAFNAADPDQPVRIVLAWSDAIGHGLGGSTPAWVNDLDLTVQAGQDSFLGNVIGTDGWSAAGGQADDKNNMEAVFLPSTTHEGSFSINVTAANIAGDALAPHAPASPRQDFALSCYNCQPAETSFTLELEPKRLGTCIPETDPVLLDASIQVGAIGDPEVAVELNSSGEPSGVSSTFQPDSIDPPGQAIWNLLIDPEAQPGGSTIKLTASDGSVTREQLMSLELIDSPPGPVQLQPENAAEQVDLEPLFSWQPIDDAIEYQIQIATDPAFDHIVLDERLASDVFQPTEPLDSETEFFWRVQATNTCGSGQWSDTWRFTTRVQPRIHLSDTGFQIAVQEGDTDSFTLTISNTGSGMLEWALTTDEAEIENPDRDHVAELDEELALASFALPAQGQSEQAREGGLASRGQVVGFTFKGTVSGVSGTGGWASDMAMTVNTPEGQRHSVGGYQVDNEDWDFQGSASGSDGSYESTHTGPEIFGENGASDTGEWLFEFTNTWNYSMDWSGVSVTLHKSTLPYCVESLTEAAWLRLEPDFGAVETGMSEAVDIEVDATELLPGEYQAYLCITTNDPRASLVTVLVELTVTDSTIFRDRFESMNSTASD